LWLFDWTTLKALSGARHFLDDQTRAPLLKNNDTRSISRHRQHQPQILTLQRSITTGDLCAQSSTPSNCNGRQLRQLITALVAAVAAHDSNTVSSYPSAFELLAHPIFHCSTDFAG
jgi:hypothetical protein